MNKSFCQLDREICNSLAMEYFIRDAGLNKEGPKFERMRADAFRVRDMIDDRVKIRAGYGYTQDFSIEGRRAFIEGVEFICNAFEQVDSGTVKGVYFYALSVGDFAYPDEPIMNQLYADIWGTAFTDAARILLKRELEKENKLSDNFGPGLYGMDVKEMGKIINFVKSESLAIEVSNSSILIPLKSCAGLYFAVNDNYQLLHRECENCRGSKLSCSLCHVHEGDR